MTMRIMGKIGVTVGFIGITVLSLGMLMSFTAYADRMTSTNFILNGDTNNAFGGQTGSTNYAMFSTGGEAVIGKGTSGSFILGGGFSEQQEKSIQLTVQPTGLLGYWSFDETAGTRYTDASTTRADATKGGANDDDISATTGKIGNGLVATGANDDSRIVIPAASIQPASITVEAWVRVNSFGGDAWDSVCSFSAVAGQDWGPWELYTDGATSNGSQVNFYWNVQNGTPHQISSSPGNFSLNSWHHVVGTYDAATGISKLYVNGVERASGTFAAADLNYTVANSANQISCFNSLRFPGEGIRGGVDQLKIFDRALTSAEVVAEYNAQNSAVPTGLTLGTITPGSSNTVLNDVIIRTDSAAYGVAVSQNHDLQKGAATIPSIGASIASPAAWSEGTTKGLGFTLLNAPSLDSKWNSGASYAAIPGSATMFYSRSSHSNSDTIDVLNGRLRLDVAASQEIGDYSNTVTYTGTIVP